MSFKRATTMMLVSCTLLASAACTSGDEAQPAPRPDVSTSTTATPSTPTTASTSPVPVTPRAKLTNSPSQPFVTQGKTVLGRGVEFVTPTEFVALSAEQDRDGAYALSVVDFVDYPRASVEVVYPVSALKTFDEIKTQAMSNQEKVFTDLVERPIVSVPGANSYGFSAKDGSGNPILGAIVLYGEPGDVKALISVTARANKFDRVFESVTSTISLPEPSQ